MQTRMFCWSMVLFALASGSQIQIEASNLTGERNDDMFLAAASTDTIPSQQQFASGRLSRRAKAAQKRLLAPTTTTKAKADTNFAAKLQAIKALPRDSSARIAQFTYIRKDEPMVEGTYHKTHPLFLADPPIVKYRTSLDSSKWVYRLQYMMNDNDVKIPIDVPLEEYTSLRLRQTIRQNWESMAQVFTLQGEAKTSLGDLMGSITKIELPIPKNPIFSIFGPNIIKLNVNGAIDIHAGFRNTKYDLATSSPIGQSQSAPDFKQQIQVTVDGDIGDKLKISADWNTQRTFEYENQLHVKYKGYQDEIVQSVEAGNVSLPTNSSFISGGSALFGIMAKFQIGPLRLTGVATQKKGQIKEISVSGGGEAKPIEIRPTDYSQNHFFVDSSYRSLYSNYYLNNVFVDTMTILDIEVWVTSTASIRPQGARNVVAFMSQDSVLQKYKSADAKKKNYEIVPGEVEQGVFEKLESAGFDFDRYTGVISLKTAIQPNQAVAVYYLVNDKNHNPKPIGNSGQEILDNDSTKLVLKLVRPTYFGSNQKNAWKLQLKNRYPLNMFGIDPQSFKLYIEYQLPGQTAVREIQNIGLLELFGLDRFSGSAGATPPPDKEFDYISGKTIDEANGEIIFPTVEPFDSSSIAYFLSKHDQKPAENDIKLLADSLAFRAIYDTSASAAQNDMKNRYYLRGTAKGSGQSSFTIGFNTVEGSVVVTSGGQTLVPGVDYTVDYISSKVFIKNQMYLAPGKDIQIKYEANDMFQLASKSMLGARGEFDVSRNTTVGFTIMNYSQQSLSDKVRVGEEPISNMMLGADLRTSFDAPWLTEALNFIPGIKSIVPSKISFSTEAAYMLPNPNTRTSPVQSDGGKGVAYIDDFEGARQTIPLLGSSYLNWKDASAPWYSQFIDSLYTPGGTDGRTIPIITSLLNHGISADTEKMNYKAYACWFNVLPTDLVNSSIWSPDRKSNVAGENQVTALNFYFAPALRGEFNYSMNLENTIGLNNSNSHKRSWAGMQRVLGTTSTDLIEQNVSFIELWVKIVGDPNAKLNIDLGFISEDVIPDQRLETEDGLGLSSHAQNGTLDSRYDWGIDTLSDAMEVTKFANFIAKYPQYASDPSGDDWSQLPVGGTLNGFSDVDRYKGVNGTEGNHLSEEGRVTPDGEDLDGNRALNRVNNYFEYEVPLDTNSIDFKKLVSGEGYYSWKQIRIPISDYTRKIGDPSFTTVQGVRVWTTGAEGPVLLRIVDFNLVGNQWEKRDRADSSYEISVVSYEDNPKYNSQEIGVSRQPDLARKDKTILGNEQSLNIIVRSLKDGEEKEAVRNFSSKPLDMFNYRTLKMFIHGQSEDDFTKGYHAFRFDSTNMLNYDARFFIRFGDDIYNFYEYSAPLHPGWKGNDVEIKFADLTALKALASEIDSVGVAVENGPIGSIYRMLGNPRLDAIKFISIGIINPKRIGNRSDVLVGELWADELRLTDVDNTPGWAYKVDAKILLADVGSLSFSFTEQNPFFHQLEVPFGSRNTSISWNISSAFSFGKLLPDSWAGTMIDASYSHTEVMNKPRYLPGQDVLVEKAANAVASGTSTDTTNKYKNADDVRLRSQDLTITDTYLLPSIKLNIPLRTWLITETINKMTFGFNYTSTHLRNPSLESSDSWSWGTSLQYATQFNKKNYITPFSIFGDFYLLRPWKNFKFFFTPQQFTFGATLSRTRSESHARTETQPSLPSHSMSSTRSMSFNWQFFEAGLLDFGLAYNVSISSSLDHLEKRGDQFRSFSDILGDIFFSDRLVDFGIDLSYDQSMSFNTKITTPKVLMLDKIFTPSFKYGVSYKWQNNIQMGPIGKSAGWVANPSFSLDINLKPVSDLIWSPMQAAPKPSTTIDTTGGGKPPGTESGMDLTRMIFKNTFFDFEKINISFTQSNSSQNNGILGGNGFANIFARVPFFQSSLNENGPSLLYQLGLISDPSGRLILKTKGTFPFIFGYTDPGPRAVADSGEVVSLTDNYTQTNNLTFQTSRPLWEGATLDLNWKIGWMYNETRNSSDTNGTPFNINSTVVGNISRSYISLPSFLMFKLFNTNLDNVNEKFKALKDADKNNANSTDAAKLSQAFEEGLEAIPWLSKILGPLAPRVNWSLRWSGLEKLGLFKSFASAITLDHSYSSTYTKTWKLTQGIGEEITSESVMYGFAPLIGISISFKELGKGTLAASFKYNLTANYDLTPSSLAVGEKSNSDIAVSASYSRQGFEIPFFGLSLMNNIDISLNYSMSHINTIRYDFTQYQSAGIPLDGISTSTIEPRIRYTLSERVTIALYYRYMKVTPDQEVSKTPGSTTNEGGLDINIAIK